MAKRRVVITGVGMVTALGLTVADTWQNIKAGKSGVSLIDQFDTTDYACRFSASIKNFDPLQYFSSKDARKMGIFMQYGVVAANEALQDARILTANLDKTRVGVAIGSGVGGLLEIENTYATILNSGSKRVSPFFIPSSIINLINGHLSIQHGLQGPTIAMVSACTTGTHNIGQAARMIAYGDADVMLAGGAEMATTSCGIGGFIACRALSLRNADPTRASRPWDQARDGFVSGDGAGVLVLEEYHHAKQRGANIYAELIGFGMSSDGYHITAPHPEGTGAAMAMQNALKDAGLTADAVDYINAHATSTPAGDELEIQAIKTVFGNHAYQLAVSSSKSMIGHLLGAAGAVEAIFSILAIQDNIAPPTINLDNPALNCDLNLVPHTAQARPINVALSNSFGFGGTNGALLFARVAN